VGPGVAGDEDEGSPESGVEEDAEAVPELAVLGGSVGELAIEGFAHVGRVLLFVAVLPFNALIVHRNLLYVLE
jgi:hypothetical protein